ncbi:MAG TPA: winged helix-turn-helix transcriptional regulator [Candidatus Altiarchaeales archaeon]|nr:winged helix-turn-helix transcriptional regulator [Candidatus Altiarchaeales archaeon]HEX54902.1 winged helix-turn-helix transcriptional regulator [Candidatus Altiarchaeales archaeon]
MMEKIIIRRRLPPRTKDLESDIRWICECLGLSERDKCKPAYKIFHEILFSLSRNSRIDSNAMAKKFNLTRGAVNYHIRYLIDSGILVRRGKRIALRSGNLTRTLEEMQRDINMVFEEMKRISSEIDRELGLEYR